jgi:putative flavoprotein involved in K+ transport
VVVAMANYQQAMVPASSRQLDPGIVQFHSSEYRNPTQLRKGGVLVVGAGNSGAELALEFARVGHRTWLSGRDVGQVPFGLAGFAAQRFLTRALFRVVFHRVLTADTPIGRRARPQMLTRAAPLIRVKSKDLARVGVTRVPRATGVHGGKPLLEDGQVLDVSNVVWCTGYQPGFSWIDLPVLDQRGLPQHRRGIAIGDPALSFVGLQFLYAMSSAMIHGVGRDAAYIAERIASARHAAEAPEVYRETASTG